MQPRSARNCNPLNIRVGDNWQGLIPRDQMTPEQAAESDFCVFKAPEWGFRAAAISTRNAIQHGPVRTLSDWVSRWAPASENNVDAYLDDVTKRSGINADAKLDPANYQQMFALLKAAATHETGAWGPYFHDTDLDKGLALAGVQGAYCGNE